MSNYLVDGTRVDDWEDCAVPGCQNKRCARLAPSPYCYPHSEDPASSITKDLDRKLAGEIEVEATGGDLKPNE